MIKYFSLLILSVFLIFSCKKESDIGLKTQPGSDKINIVYTDTIELEAFSKNYDSIASYNNSMALLGSYNDQIFGYTHASFITQARLSSVGIKFPANATFESLSLEIQYNGYYGGNSTSQTVNVYEINNTLYKDTAYYSNLNIINYIDQNNIIGSTDFSPSTYSNDTVLKINLSQELGNKLLSSPDSFYFNQVAFQKFFKGLYVTVSDQTVGSGINYFNLLGTKSKMVLKYNDNGTIKEYNFVFNSNCARINLFKHSYESTSFYSQITSNAPLQDSVFYVQSIGGVRGLIKVKNAENWQLKSNIAIVKAELIIPIEQDDNTISSYPVPSKMQLVRINSDNKFSFLDDYYLGAQYFDGNLDSISKKYYKFNIARYLQRVITGQIPNYGLVLFPENNAVVANRVVLSSGINSDKLKLLVSYTKF